MFKDRQDRQDLKEIKVRPGLRVPQVTRDQLVQLVPKVPLVFRVLPAQRDLKGILVPKVPQVFRVRQVKRVRQDRSGLLALPDQLALEALLVLQVPPVPKAPKDLPA